MNADCPHGHPRGTGYPCTACLDERVEALIQQRDEAYRKLDVANLQIAELKSGIQSARAALSNESRQMCDRRLAALLGAEKRVEEVTCDDCKKKGPKEWDHFQAILCPECYDNRLRSDIK